MCGIIAYSGSENASEKLIYGLKKLEYRGYDSAGVAVIAEDKIKTIKSVGKVKNLEEKLAKENTVGTLGIGHTRWATHGKISEENCHPHLSMSGNVAIVHNGIIENHSALKSELESDGYVFRGETDSEVISALLEKYYDGSPLKAIEKALRKLKGSYAVAAIFLGSSDKVYGFCNKSPLVMTSTLFGSYFASDIIAVENATSAIYLSFGEIGEISREGMKLYDKNLSRIGKTAVSVKAENADIKLNGYSHYMQKEIFDTPKAIENTLSKYDIESFDLSDFGLNDVALNRIKRIYVAACGSAYHAGLAFKYMAEELAGIPIDVMIASEIIDERAFFEKDSVLVAISQSGETADTLLAIDIAKKRGIKTIGIINVENSSATRKVDFVLPTNAGREIAVATTKAYSAQCLVLAILAIAIGKAKGKIETETLKEKRRELKALPEKIREVLKNSEKIRDLVKTHKNKTKFFFIGKNIDYALSLEASLKVKEITYLHAEGYPAGELKHGTISLVDENTLCFVTAMREKTMAKTLSNAEEVKSRGGTVVIVKKKDDTTQSELYETIELPENDELLSPIIAVVPYQLFAYYLAIEHNKDVDKPRNLAKSVTVE